MNIIIPIHEFNDTVKTYLSLALTSVNKQKDVSNLNVLLVYPEKIHEDVTLYIIVEKTKYDFEIVLASNPGNFDFQSQINFGVETIAHKNFVFKSEYFSILEFDDEFSEIYFRNVEQYIEAYPQIDSFLPITIQVDKFGKALSLLNDAAWSRDFIGDDGEQGFLSMDSLKKHTMFALTGGVFKTNSFRQIGGLKKNLQLTFGYEFLLRMLNSDQKIMVISRVGYKHVVDREDCLFLKYTNTMSFKERKFWFDIANKEYYFNQDREIDISALKSIESDLNVAQ
jgi:hypothetical protein